MGGEPGDPTGGDLIERELEAHRAREEMERVKREQAQRAREAADTAAQDAVSRAREMIRTFLATVAPLGPATLEAVDVVERDSTQRNGIRHDFTRRVGRAHGWLIAAGRERHPVYKIEGSYYILLRQDG